MLTNLKLSFNPTNVSVLFFVMLSVLFAEPLLANINEAKLITGDKPSDNTGADLIAIGKIIGKIVIGGIYLSVFVVVSWTMILKFRESSATKGEWGSFFVALIIAFIVIGVVTIFGIQGFKAVDALGS